MSVNYAIFTEIICSIRKMDRRLFAVAVKDVLHLHHFSIGSIKRTIHNVGVMNHGYYQTVIGSNGDFAVGTSGDHFNVADNSVNSPQRINNGFFKEALCV